MTSDLCPRCHGEGEMEDAPWGLPCPECHGVGTTEPEPEWWGVAEAASHCGIQPATWRGYVSTGHAPAPADPDDGYPPNRRRPRWKADTVRAWQDGRPKRPGRPRKTDTNGDQQ